MRRMLLRSVAAGLAALGLLGRAAPARAQAPAQQPNTLTAAEKAAGWTLLFDGSTTKGWRGYQMTTVPAGWQVVDGALTRVGEGADLITDGQYARFELSLEWMIAPKGNSGIMYRVTEADSFSYMTGPEYQVLDDEGHRDGLSRLTAAAAVYGLYPSPEGLTRPPGQWNQARIVVKGDSVQHWLNGTLAAQYVLGSPDFNAKVAASKFAKWPGFGKAATGHIALQDHGDRVAYRSIKLRVLP